MLDSSETTNNMNKDIRLYIGDHLADLGGDTTFPMTYEQESFSNPTVIKIG